MLQGISIQEEIGNAVRCKRGKRNFDVIRSSKIKRQSLLIRNFFNLFPVFFFLLFELFTPMNIFGKEDEVEIYYRSIIDSLQVTHSGQTVGKVMNLLRVASDTTLVKLRKQDYDVKLQALKEQRLLGLISNEEYQERYSKILANVIVGALYEVAFSPEQIEGLKALVEPFLEPYAFLLEDAIETLDLKQFGPILIEVANLFSEGEPQPAWVDLLRTHRYFVLSDGKGYVRMFIPGNSADSAYRRHYPVLRHVITWLMDSVEHPDGLSVDIYAYENDFSAQKLRLKLPAYNLHFSSYPKSPRGSVSVDLQGIDEFLKKGLTLEGAHINDNGELILFGSEREHRPTLEGQPLSLAYMAVAYRAVFHSGYGDAYVSLDPSFYPEQVNVNFGGRLQDTRMGWVVLRADMRFKTIANALDPITGEDLRGSIRQIFPDFLTQKERLFSLPIERRPISEDTRFWFYPDSIAIVESQDGRFLKIRSPRFTAAAERQEAWAGNKKLAKMTPPWTTEVIAHLNQNYEAYAELFPEIRELDTVGRLLALFTWLKQKQDNGMLRLDLDILMNIELPKCTTLRRKPQFLVSYFVTKEDNKQRTFLFDCSEIAERWTSRRRKLRFSEQELRQQINRYLAAAVPDALGSIKTMTFIDSLMDLATTEKLQSIHFQLEQAQFNNEILKLGKKKWSASKIEQVDQLEFLQYYVISGGIELDLTKQINQAQQLSALDLNVYNKLIQSSTNTGIKPVNEKWRLLRSESNPLHDIPLRPRGVPHQLSKLKELKAKDETVWTTDLATTTRHLSLSKSESGNLRWIRNGVIDPWSSEPSRTIHFANDKSVAAITRYEQNRLVHYRLTGSKEKLVAKPISSHNGLLTEDMNLVSKAQEQGLSSDWIWKNLPENTAIVAIEKTPDGETAVLHKSGDQFGLTFFKKDRVVKSVKCPGVLTEFDEIARGIVRAASDKNIKFVHAAIDGDDLLLQVGEQQKRIPTQEVKRIIDNPTSSEKSSLDDIFAAHTKESVDFVVYRDATERRPPRYGGSLKAGTEADPVRLVALLNERYEGIRAYLDDETEIAKRNRQTISLISGASDLAAMVPEESFAITDHSLIQNIRSHLHNSGIKVIDSGADAGTIPNILLITGHNDINLFEYLTHLGTQGILRDKVILLNTCYSDGKPDLLHELIVKYGARGVFLHSESIRPIAIQKVMIGLGEILKEAEQKGQKIHPADLLKQAAERTLLDKNLSDRLRHEIRKLIRGALQISYIQINKNGMKIRVRKYG